MDIGVLANTVVIFLQLLPGKTKGLTVVFKLYGTCNYLTVVQHNVFLRRMKISFMLLYGAFTCKN